MGVLVNVDSYDEFKWIEEFANKSETHCQIGLRLNFNLEGSPSRFGVHVNDETIHKIISGSKRSKFLTLESLHYHYASRRLSAWKNCMNKFLSFLTTIEADSFDDIRYISLGGYVQSNESVPRRSDTN